jgi:hypothetical protein
MSRSQNLVSFGHDIVFRAHDLVSRGLDTEPRAHHLIISFQRLSNSKPRQYRLQHLTIPCA